MTKEEERVARGAGKVAFWAHKESIKKMLDDKYTLTATYLAHKKDVNIKYQQFRRYVKEFIRSQPDGDSGSAREEGKDIKKAVVVRTREPGQPAFVSSDTPRDKDSLVKRKE